jgi:hypothetical protein
VRYYRGNFDRQRVDYRNRDEAAGAGGRGSQHGGWPPPPPSAPLGGASLSAGGCQWKCEVDSGDLVDYSTSINDLLEGAFNRLGTTADVGPHVEFVGHGGNAYIGDVVAGVQTNRSTRVKRRMVRYVNGQTSSLVTRLDSRSGRHCFIDKLNPDQPATWMRTLGCPAQPFSVAGRAGAGPVRGPPPALPGQGRAKANGAAAILTATDPALRRQSSPPRPAIDVF